MKTIYVLLIGASLAFTSCGGSDETTTSETSTETVSTTETCPHCSGLGRRTNQVTGEFTDCSSCGGDGKVTSEQYNSLSK